MAYQSLTLLTDVDINQIEDRKILIGNTPERLEQQWTFSGHTEAAYTIAVDSDQNTYSGGYDNTIRSIDSNGNEVWSFTNHTNTIHRIALDLNNNIYSASSDNTIRKIDSNGSETWSFTGFNESVYSVAVDTNNNYVYGGGETLRKIDFSNNEITTENWPFTNHTGRINDIVVDSSGYLYSASNDGTVRKIDSSGAEVWAFNGHATSVNGIAVDNSGYTYTGSWDYTIRKIDPSGSEVWKIEGSGTSGYSISLNSTEQYIYVGDRFTGNYTIKKVSTDSGNVIWSENLGVHASTLDSQDNIFIGEGYQGGTQYLVKKYNENQDTSTKIRSQVFNTNDLGDVHAETIQQNSVLFSNNSRWIGSPILPFDGFNLQNISNERIFIDIGDHVDDPNKLLFGNNGSTLIIADNDAFVLRQFTLSTPYDISTATYDEITYNPNSEISVDEQRLIVDIDNTGSKLYVADFLNSIIYQFTLSTPYDISTATYDTITFDHSGSSSGGPIDITLNDDGSKLYILTAIEEIYQYTLSTPNDISTASYDGTFIEISTYAPAGSAQNISINDGGNKLFYGANSSGSVDNATLYQFTLSTPNDISTASYNGTFYGFGEIGASRSAGGFAFNASGTTLYICNLDNIDGHKIYQFITISNKNISSLNNVSVESPTNSQVISYNQSTGQWENADLPSSVASIDDLDDVDTTTTTPSDGDVLTWNNSNSEWEPQASSGGGSSTLTVTTISVNTTLAISTADAYLVDSGAVATLPAASDNNGVVFYVKNIDGSTITIDTAGGNIDGSASTTLSTQYESLAVISNGTDWFII